MNQPKHHILLYIILLIQACIVRISAFPHNNATDGDMEIITVEDIVSESNVNIAKNLTAALITQNNEEKTQGTNSNISISSSSMSSAQNDASNEPVIDTADDLIFLAERPQEYSGSREQQELQQQQEQQKSSSSIGTFQQIDLLTSAEEDSLRAISTSPASKSSKEHFNVVKLGNDEVGDRIGDTTTARIKHVSDYNTAGTNKDKNNTSEGDSNESDDDDGGADDDDVVVVSTITATPIDMSDFVALIPTEAVKSIAANYYNNDPEVQRAYAYLNSPDFVVLRQHIIVLPEVKAFLRYLNNSGLDVVGFLYTLTNLTSKPDELMSEDNIADNEGSGSDAIMANEIENGYPFTQITTTAPLQPEGTTNGEEPVKGLHGLVDSVLDILPQDQILATFFEKLESNEQFTKLVDRIGQPAFARIIHNLQISPQLRTMVFTLHNNGIYISRIVDSLKAYFFLGTF